VREGERKKVLLFLLDIFDTVLRESVGGGKENGKISSWIFMSSSSSHNNE
jgi:hypothetical protein